MKLINYSTNLEFNKSVSSGGYTITYVVRYSGLIVGIIDKKKYWHFVSYGYSLHDDIYRQIYKFIDGLPE